MDGNGSTKELEEGSRAAGGADLGRAVEMTRGTLRQPAGRLSAVAFASERVQGGEGAIGSYLKSRTVAGSCAIEIAVSAQRQSSRWAGAIIPASERVQSGKGPIGGYVEDRARASRAAGGSRAIENAISAQRQSGQRVGAVGAIEGDQPGKSAVGGDSEEGAIAAARDIVGAAVGSCAIEIAIRTQRQPGNRIGAIGGVEGRQPGEDAIGSDLEDSAITAVRDVVRASILRRAIEVAIRALGQPSQRISAIGAAERGQDGKEAVGGDLEDRAIAAVRGVVRAAVRRCAIKIAIGAQHQPGFRISAIGAVERSQNGVRAVGGQFEDRAKTAVVRAAVRRRAIEIAIHALRQPGGRCGAIGIVVAKYVEGAEDAISAEFEDRPISAQDVACAVVGCRAVEIAVRGLRQPGHRLGAVGPRERDQRREQAIGRYSVNGAIPAGAAASGRAVENRVGALDHAGLGISASGVVERQQRGERAAGGHFEYRAVAAVVHVVRAAVGGRAVEIAVFTLNHPAIGSCAIVATRERIQGGKDTGAGDFEDRAAVIRAAVGRGAIEIAVFALNQAGHTIAAIVAVRERYSLVRTPLVVILKTVPSPPESRSLAPPYSVVP